MFLLSRVLNAQPGKEYSHMASRIKGKRDERSVAYYIFRTKMTVNGVTIYAKDYGHRAFRIPIYR